MEETSLMFCLCRYENFVSDSVLGCGPLELLPLVRSEFVIDLDTS